MSEEHVEVEGREGEPLPTMEYIEDVIRATTPRKKYGGLPELIAPAPEEQ